MERLTLQIDGMSCGHCLNAVNRALQGLAGAEVGSVTIGRAVLTYDPARLDPAVIVAAVTDAGYPATVAPASP